MVATAEGRGRAEFAKSPRANSRRISGSTGDVSSSYPASGNAVPPPATILADARSSTPSRALAAYSERLGNSEEVARAIAFLCSPAVAYITGTQLEISSECRGTCEPTPYCVRSSFKAGHNRDVVALTLRAHKPTLARVLVARS